MNNDCVLIKKAGPSIRTFVTLSEEFKAPRLTLSRVTGEHGGKDA